MHNKEFPEPVQICLITDQHIATDDLPDGKLLFYFKLSRQFFRFPCETGNGYFEAMSTRSGWVSNFI